jgi:hypothetical protein
MKWRLINKDWLYAVHKSHTLDLTEHHFIRLANVARVTYWEDERGVSVSVYSNDNDCALFAQDEFPSKEELTAILSFQATDYPNETEPHAEVKFIAVKPIHCPFCGVQLKVIPWHYSPNEREAWLRLVKAEGEQVPCRHVITEWFYLGQDLTKDRIEELMKTLVLSVLFVQ